MEGFDCLNLVGIFLSVFTVVLIGIYRFMTRNFDFWKKQGIPGDVPRFFIGTLQPFWKKGMTKQEEDSLEKYGPTYGAFEGATPVLVTKDPELIKSITVKHFSAFPSRKEFGNMNKVVTKMISVMKGDEWKETRQILSPAYTAGKLKGMMDLFETCVKSSIDNLEKLQGEEIEMRKFFWLLSARMIGSCAFGLKIENLEDPENEFFKRIAKLFTPPNFLLYLRILFPQLFKYTELVVNPLDYFVQLARQTIEIRMKDDQNFKRNDFLQIMLDSRKDENLQDENEKKRLTDDVIIAQVALFLFAGHDTVANAMTLMAYSLATNEDIQEKLVNEIDEAISENGGQISYEMVIQLKYLDMVLSETLRLYPPAVRINRKCAQDNFKLNNIIFNSSCLVSVPVYWLHRDPKMFPNPEKFDPERFTQEEKSQRHPFAYIPFGSGPRNCLAMRFALTEIKVTMSHILSQYRFKICSKTQIPVKINDSSFALLQPSPVFLMVTKRND